MKKNKAAFLQSGQYSVTWINESDLDNPVFEASLANPATDVDEACVPGGGYRVNVEESGT